MVRPSPAWQRTWACHHSRSRRAWFSSNIARVSHVRALRECFGRKSLSRGGTVGFRFCFSPTSWAAEPSFLAQPLPAFGPHSLLTSRKRMDQRATAAHACLLTLAPPTSPTSNRHNNCPVTSKSERELNVRVLHIPNPPAPVFPQPTFRPYPPYTASSPPNHDCYRLGPPSAITAALPSD